MKRPLLFCLLLIFSFAGSLSQSPYFEQLKTLKSKKKFEVKSIFQDKTGYMWFATSEGLLRFDGIDYKLFTTKDGMSQNLVTAMAIDSSNNIWLGYKNGTIDIFNGNIFKVFKTEEGPSKTQVSSILFDKQNDLWFSTLGEGIYCFKGKYKKRIRNINTQEGLSDDYVYTLTLSANNEIFAGTDYGINIMTSDSLKVSSTITMNDGLPDNIVKHLAFDKKGILWIGMEDKGICSYNLTTRTFFNKTKWQYGSLNNFVILSTGEIWASTVSEGVVRVSLQRNNQQDIKQFTTNQGLHCNKTDVIFADREHNIWIGCYSGITKGNTNSFEFLDSREGLNIKNIYGFVTDKYGNYWIASSQGLFIIKKDNKKGLLLEKVFKNPDKISRSFISLYSATDGYIWAGTYGYGVFQIDPLDLSYKNITSKEGLANDNVISISGFKNKIWFSTLGGGATLYSHGESPEFKTFNIKSGLSSNYLYSVYTDSRNRVWFALDGGGISKLENRKIQSGILHMSDSVNVVYSYAEDRNHNIWISTPDKGCFVYDNKTYKNYNESNGLLSNNIRSISADGNGNILIVSNEGIQIYDPDAFGFENYGINEGLASLEPGLNSIFKDNEGDVWIGTENSIVLYKSQKSDIKKVLPEVRLTSVLLYFNPISTSKTSFSYTENHLTFEYSGFWFQSPDNLQYRYMLENYDYSWSKATNIRSVTYSNLPSGSYTFKVQVSYKPGDWINATDAPYAFSIRPPFWKTWWFIMFSVLTIGSFIVLYIRLRFKKLVRDKQILEEEVQRRTATIQFQNEKIEAQLQQISLQNQNITSSIQYASRIQNAVLPPNELLDKHLKDFFILNKPMSIVSGDFYWFSERDQKYFIAVADCTGHGVPGAFMSMLGITLLNHILSHSTSLQAHEVLNSLRTLVKEALRQTGKIGEAQDGMDITFLVYDKNKNQLQFSGANSSFCVISNNKILVYRGDKMPIGIFVNERDFTSTTINLEPNDILYLYSDGYQDQLGGPNEITFKAKKMQELLLSISNKPMKEQKIILEHTMNKWKDGYPQNDDILVVGIKV